MTELPDDLSQGLTIARLVAGSLAFGVLAFAGFSGFLIFSGNETFGGDINVNYMRLGFYVFAIGGFVVANYVTAMLRSPDKLKEDNDEETDANLSPPTTKLFSSTLVGLAIA
ncbi:MAG: hypothetical protein ABEK50_15860 [bacterium]